MDETINLLDFSMIAILIVCGLVLAGIALLASLTNDDDHKGDR